MRALRIALMGSLTCELCGNEKFRQLPKGYIDSATDVVASFVLFLLHHIYFLFLKLSYWLSSLPWKWLVRRGLVSLPCNSPALDSTQNEKCHVLRKVPNHCAFILGVELPSYRDLSSIVEWSLASRIHHISFYSHLDALDPVALFDEISKSRSHIIPKIKWGKNFTFEVKKLSSKRINGYSWKPEITVHIYKKKDGVDSLSEVTRELYSTGAKSITLSELRNVMEQRIKAPDPDLAVVCGQFLALYAFLPWHCRVTQLQLLDSHHCLTKSHFVSLLFRYSQSEQKYGK